MGFKHVDAALKAKVPPVVGIETGTMKSVLVAICQHADNKNNACFPSITRLTKMTQHARSSVSKAIHCLNTTGVFTYCQIGSGHTSSHFIIDLPKLLLWEKTWSTSPELPEEEVGVRVETPEFGERTQSSVGVPRVLETPLNLSLTGQVDPSRNTVIAPNAPRSPSTPLAKSKAEPVKSPSQTLYGLGVLGKSKSTPKRRLVKTASKTVEQCFECGWEIIHGEEHHCMEPL